VSFDFRIDIILLTLCAHTHIFTLEVNLIFHQLSSLRHHRSHPTQMLTAPSSEEEGLEEVAY
jgi:hypothetical protein